MSEKGWRIRWFSQDGPIDFICMAGTPFELAVLIAFDGSRPRDTRKPFVYYDDHARGPVDCLSCGAGDPADESCCNGDCFCHERAS